MNMTSRGTVGVFGAKGFIGRHLVARLLRDGIPVVAFGRGFSTGYAEAIGHVEQREIEFSDVIGTHAKLLDISVVVQLINSSSPSLGNSHVAADFKSNVEPHVGFLESCGMAGVKSIVFLSSGGTVYGNPDYLPIDENHRTAPMNSYGLSKLTVEHYVRLLSHTFGMDYVNLRVANPFGKGQTVNKGQGLIASIVQRHADRLPVTVYGDGSAERDYLYIDDVIDAIIAAIGKQGIRETLNIGSGIGRSVLEVIAALEQAIGEKIDVVFAEGRNTDARSNVLDARLAGKILGWSPQIPFVEGLRRTIAPL